ncbi:hypothetical protein [Shewanella psychrotolerans]|uniref:hypothetical protein n=1 Tax=Shewanella psychrotolerans TaxID=2864206 RepID=UPI001C661F80|nr:hypothetical protein [Shewanella psychrotolerans]QYK02663.1 hypothetical protein K0I62_06890 [Shewanella psychrotolerans]
MLELVVFICLIVIYFVINKEHQYDPEVIGAIAFITVYLGCYLLLPPYVQSPRIGQLFGMLPMGCFALILFPQLNANGNERVTKAIAWSFMVLILPLLCLFKFVIW